MIFGHVELFMFWWFVVVVGFFLAFGNLQVYTILAGSLVHTGIEATACDL